jgi:hypothetical protein
MEAHEQMDRPPTPDRAADRLRSKRARPTPRARRRRRTRTIAVAEARRVTPSAHAPAPDDPLPLDRLFEALHLSSVYRSWRASLGVAVLLFLLTLAVYHWSNQGEATPFNHYVLLADAMLDGRLYLRDPAPYLEVAVWQDRAYVIYPPMPALLLLPFVALFGAGVSQTSLSIVLGAANVALCYLVVLRFFGRRTLALWIALLYGFGTVQWYHAANGAAWYIAHVVALFFLWLALLEATGAGRLFLIGLLIGCAFMARVPTLCAAAFVLVYFWERFVPRRDPSGRLDLRTVAPSWLRLSGGLSVGLLLTALYNLLRFDDPLQSGNTLIADFDQLTAFPHGLFSPRYVPQHLSEMFTRLPALQPEWPYVVPRIYAMAVWFTTPAFFLILGARFTTRLGFACLIAVLVTAVPILMHGASGFTQFGYRYTLDFTPFLLLLTASGIGRTLSWWKKGLILASIAINLWGVVLIGFYGITAF